MKLFCILLVLYLICFPASAEDITENELLSGSIREMEKSGFDISRGIEAIKNGEIFSIGEVTEDVLSLFLGELKNNIGIVSELVIVAVLTGIMCNLKPGKENTGVSSLAFFSGYSVISTLCVSSFYGQLKNALEAIGTMRLFMQSFIPVLVSLSSITGGVSLGATLSPGLFASMQIITFAAEQFLLPLIFTVTSLSVVNNLSGRFHITSLIRLIRQIIKWSLGFMLTVFVGLLGIQGFIGTFLDGMTGKTVRFALCNFIPIVGGVLADSIDAVIFSGRMVKNTVGVSGLITLVLVTVPPVLKIAATGIMYRIAAGIAEPATDKRIVTLFGEVAESISQISAILLVICVMFIISVAMLLILGGAMIKG